MNRKMHNSGHTYLFHCVNHSPDNSDGTVAWRLVFKQFPQNPENTHAWYKNMRDKKHVLRKIADYREICVQVNFWW